MFVVKVRGPSKNGSFCFICVGSGLTCNNFWARKDCHRETLWLITKIGKLLTKKFCKNFDFIEIQHAWATIDKLLQISMFLLINFSLAQMDIIHLAILQTRGALSFCHTHSLLALGLITEADYASPSCPLHSDHFV